MAIERTIPPAASPRVVLVGASASTGNLGVTALGRSLIDGIAARVPEAMITMLDGLPGERPAQTTVEDQAFEYRLCGAIPTRRIYDRNSIFRMSHPVTGASPARRAIAEADAVLDITGGDSFTDLYGARRFRWTSRLKTIALQLNRPLILPPQTIGPFQTRAHRIRATDILRRASLVWTRDEASLAKLEGLLGASFDPERHRLGVDVAFALAPRLPSCVPGGLAEWIHSCAPIAGLNVSGLLFNEHARAARRFGLKADYRTVVIELARRLLDTSDTNLLLVPHVMTNDGHPEHDLAACEAVRDALPPSDRVVVLSGVEDPGQAKWFIGHTNWFCGTRMHAAIAALSSCVPTSAIAYSEKTAGVFATCQERDAVIDPRERETHAVIDALYDAWQDREASRTRLLTRIPEIHAQTRTQMDEIASACLNARHTHRAA